MKLLSSTVRLLGFLAAVLALTVPVAVPAGAAEQAGFRSVSQTDNVRAELVAELSSVSPGASFWVALRLDIRKGWHTYWRNPGDSGEPTRIRWSLPAGVTASDIHWPFPRRIPYGPLVNYGYENRVLHLVRMQVDDRWAPGQALEATADASWLVCEDICIPEAASFRLTLPAATGPARLDPASAAEIDRARARLPATPPLPGRVEVRGDSLVLDVATGVDGANISSAIFFPYEWGYVEPAGAQELEVRGDRLNLKMVRGENVPEVLDGVLVIEERNGDSTLERAVEISAAREVSKSAVSGATSIASIDGAGAGVDGVGGLAGALALAFLGGLILNLMPCVFPVLSVKAIGIVGHAARSSRHLRLSGLVYTAGVLAFMALVGGVLIALKGAGAEIGWGFQLQSPAFVAVMALILFTLGLSLSGYFAFGASVMGWGGGLAGRSDAMGSFYTGALAALVATPCTAPFMGAAIGFALAQPWAAALLVMLALGLGLAFPYLMLTWIPGLAGRLPRPGPWMDRLKQLLAFPLYAAAAWLVWVLSMQTGPPGVIAVLSAMILVAFAIWLLRATRDAGRKWRLAGSFATALAAVAAIGLGLLPQVLLPVPGEAAAARAERLAKDKPFSTARLQELRAAGTPVFVNITAAWCITCKVNEQVALSSERVARVFSDRGIVYLKGDWTNRDAEISRYLRSYGRGGVPLYVVYDAAGNEPRVLPQLLTETLVLEAVKDMAEKTDPPTQEKRS
jgi:thiol:disulfide interchange protein DsbD